MFSEVDDRRMNEKLPVRAKAAVCAEERSLAVLLKPRIEVEADFERLGHTYRHGPLHRFIENHVTRPVLRHGLRLAGLYRRGVSNALSPVVRRVTIRCSHLPTTLDGFVIMQLSDFHIDGVPGLVDAIVPVLKRLRPDLCILTGDYRFEDWGPYDHIYPLLEPIFDSINAPYGTFAILGNHDHSEMAFALEDRGIRMLVNEAVEIVKDDASLWMVGLDDHFDFRCADLKRALSSVPSGAFKVLAVHAPELYREAAAENVHLYLAGHTHAGQIRLPLIGSVRHNAKCPRAYTAGSWSHGNMQGYTTNGIGCSSLPVRFNCPPEIVLLELRSAASRSR